MPRPYSNDLRERVAASVAQGRSCRATAALFSVSVASVVKWSQRQRATGSAAAKPMGRRRRRLLAGEVGWLQARLAARADLTLHALAAELRERGLKASPVSVWRVLREAGFSFKKNAVRRRAGAAPHRPAAGAVEEVPGQA